MLCDHPLSPCACPTNPITDSRSWVVVHDAWRDHYQLPAAFAETGILERLVTDWYTNADRPLWAHAAKTSVVASIPGIRTRFSALVPSSLVTDAKTAFVKSLLRRKWKDQPFDDVTEGTKSGRRAAMIANLTGSNLLSASYSAAAAFASLDPGLARILFQVHPQPRFLRNLYQQQIARDAEYADLMDESELRVSEQAMARWEQESSLADHILCASSFSKRSLVWSGIPEDRISIVPYGVDTELFKPAAYPAGTPFRVLFVGQRVARKGLRPLLRIWKEMSPKNAQLILAGGHQSSEGLLSGFDGTYVDVPRVSKEELIRWYQAADVLVLPSLAEGFGHVYLEALACGTPVLGTENTGAADLVTHGQSGWVIAAGNADDLATQLRWILEHRNQVRAMRPAARSTAERYTWSCFRQSVRDRACAAALAIADGRRLVGPAASHAQARTER